MPPSQTSAQPGHEGPVLDRRDGFDVIDCRACGFRHVHPLPTVDELSSLYDEDYYSNEKPLYIERVKEDLDWWRIVYRERLEALEQALAGGRRRLLDIGSGPGYLLETARDRDWEAIGIEPSRQAAAHSRDELGLTIVERFLDEDSAAELGTFGAVHLCNVLEHVPDPAHLLRLAGSVLDPGGVLMAIVPNDYNPLQQALREVEGFSPWWVAPPHHLNYFDTTSLPALAERVGFEVLARETTFPMELFLLMGEDYVGNDELGRACHARRKRLERTLDRAGLSGLKRGLYEALAALGIGREIQVVARKRG